MKLLNSNTLFIARSEFDFRRTGFRFSPLRSILTRFTGLVTFPLGFVVKVLILLAAAGSEDRSRILSALAILLVLYLALNVSLRLSLICFRVRSNSFVSCLRFS